jgi:(2R)-sulfolactate sulfo-lyase subunit alpha
MKPQFLVHDEHDNVGVAVAEIKAGEKLVGSCLENGAEVKVDAKDPIPLGHKVALKALKKGEDVIKYGVPVGLATEAITPGQHVHVHNIKSKRW